MPEARPRLYLIDGYSNLFRAFYAIPRLSNSKGQPTNAVYGFVNMLRKLLREEQPDLVGIAMDTGGVTFRKEEYAEYKANRAPMPDDLRAQMPFVRRAIEAFRIPIVEAERVEADDVLGTLARQAVDRGYDVVLVTADKDFMQLVSPHVTLFHSMREKRYDEAAVAEDFGVPPGQVIDVLALMGDSIDNVPGVPGIGEKGAKALIAEHGSVEALLEAADQVQRKNYREGLQQNREQALLSKRLVTIDTEVDVAFDPEALRFEDPDGEKLFELYREMEFFSLLEELEADGVVGVGSEDTEPAELAEDAARVEELLAEGSTVAVARVEAGPRLLGMALAVAPGTATSAAGTTSAGTAAADSGPGRALFADFRTPGVETAVREALEALLRDGERTLVGHDLKEILRFADSESGAVACRVVDTMLLAYLLPGAARGYSLPEVAFDRLHRRCLGADDAGLSKDAADAPPMAEHEPLLRYAAERVLLPLELMPLLEEAAATISEAADPDDDQASRPRRVYREIEAPLVPVLVAMEEAGIELDTGFLESMSGTLAAALEEVEREIYEIAGEEFNIQSPQQLGVILFDKLGYPVLKRTRKKKSYSTSAATLEELAARGYDLPEKILAHREKSKLKSTYVDALPGLVAADGRLHTRFHQAVAATGRLSSANPNLQNIPVRTEEGQQIRRAFRAGAGSVLLVADYSQIELRVLAHIAHEEALIEAFTEGADIHRATAATVFGVADELVNDEQRRAAKTINFGIIYGMSAFGLAQRLGIDNKDAARFIEAYFEQFPGVKRYTDETLARAEAEGAVSTLYGRTRYLPDIKARNWNVRENAKRMAINARIQGTAADLLKLAMIALDRRLRSDAPGARLLLTVHDELVLEVPAEDVESVAPLVRQEMEAVAELTVPLVVDVGWGETWYDAKT